MTIIVCGQAEILGHKACLWCEDLLPHVGAVLTTIGWMCSEDCAATWTETRGRHRAEAHVRARDLMCECGTCVAAGHPTDSERGEYVAGRDQAGGEQP